MVNAGVMGLIDCALVFIVAASQEFDLVIFPGAENGRYYGTLVAELIG